MVLRKTYKIKSERKLKLRSQESSHWIEVADESGLITSIGREEKPDSAVSAIKAGILLEIGGEERRAPTGGIEYFDTRLSGSVVRTGEPKLDSTDLGLIGVIPVKI
jgi:hypothetical protein